MKKIIILILLCLVLTEAAYAATVHGTLYDFSLKKLNNIIVEINTQPAQRQIAIGGSYSFNVPRGNYIISAKTADNRLIVTENIVINEEGNYTLDLIAFIEDDEEILNDTDIDIGTEIETIDNGNNTIWIIVVIIIILLAAALIFYYKYKKKSKSEKTEEVSEDVLIDKVLNIIKKQDGRITQKDIRKQFPYSEAKISLIITELESKGKIEKIKKGRSNVIILKK